MPLLKWDSSFSVNIEEIDKQHQILLKRINDLYDAMRNGKEREVLGKLINQLSVYAAMHFAKEEHYFELFAYPEIDIHKQEHSDFEQEVYQFESDFIAGRQDLSIKVMNFMGEWLINHIKGSDKKFGPFLNDRGLS